MAQSLDIAPYMLDHCRSSFGEYHVIFFFTSEENDPVTYNYVL